MLSEVNPISKPIIGITPEIKGRKYAINRAYAEAVVKSGGIPVILPYDIINLDETLNTIQGVLISGEGDIDPVRYGQDRPSGAKFSNPERDKFELALCKRLLTENMPVLCIGRGLQALNVAAGGGLASVESHWGKPELTHDILIKPGSLLDSLLPNPTEKGRVNSTHCQALGRLGDRIVPCAKSADGYIEAAFVEGKRFFIGVQWHPEEICHKDSLSERLFAGLTEAAAPLMPDSH